MADIAVFGQCLPQFGKVQHAVYFIHIGPALPLGAQGEQAAIKGVNLIGFMAREIAELGAKILNNIAGAAQDDRDIVAFPRKERRQMQGRDRWK